MMKTEIDILDIIKSEIKGKIRLEELTGVLCDCRPLNSKNEDVCVFAVSSLSGDIESAYFNVNVFVGYIYNEKTKQYEWNKARLRKLSPMFKEALLSYSKDGVYFELESQHIEAIEEKKESVIVNRLKVKFLNQ